MSEAVTETVTEVDDSQQYLRLDSVDRLAASTLSKFWTAHTSVDQSATKLTNVAALQSFVTALPLAAADFVSLYLSVYLVTGVFERLLGISTMQVENHTAFFISLVILPVANLAGLYPGIGHNPIVEFRQIAKSLFVSVAVLAGIGWFCFPEHWFFYSVSAGFAFCLALPAAVTSRYLARNIAKRFSFWGVPTLIVAEPESAAEIYRRLDSRADEGFRPVGVLLDREKYWSSEQNLEAQGIPTFEIGSATEVAVKHSVTFVIVSNCAGRNITPALDPSLAVIPNRVLLSSERIEMGIWDHLYTVGSTAGLRLASARPSSVKLFMKRFADLFIASSILLLGLPVWALFCLAIKMTSKGPIFYGQRRIGKDGHEFTAWKFRTMHQDSDKVLTDYLRRHPEARAEWDEKHKLTDDPRVTSIGKILRSTSLDELPQLWNVLVGDMSMVGPRPIINSPTYDACYIEDYPTEYKAYSSVRPGVTGLWQVRCRNRGVYELRIYYDMYYIRNWGIWLDLYLIMATFKTVLLREGH